MSWINQFIQNRELNKHNADTLKYRDHSLGSKRHFDWKTLGSAFALIMGGAAVLMFLFFYFRPAVEAWRDEALAPFQTHPLAGASGSIRKPSSTEKRSSFEKPAAPVGALTLSQIKAIEGWVKIQTDQLGMDTFQWKLVRGPDPVTPDDQMSLDVRVIWHQPVSLQTQHQVCTLTLQGYSDRSWKVIGAGPIGAAPGTACNYATAQ